MKAIWRSSFLVFELEHFKQFKVKHNLYKTSSIDKTLLKKKITRTRLQSNKICIGEIS